MSQQDRSPSFETAVRDLFRHLYDGHRLRRNPLVRSFFGHSVDQVADYVVVAEIRQSVMQAARSCYTADLAAGKRASGERMLAIITGLCSNKTPDVLLATLGLSRSQFYRDRRVACIRAANVLRSEIHKPWTARRCEMLPDPLHFVIQRAIALVDHGLGYKAIEELEKAARGAAAKVRARLLVELCNAFTSLGDIPHAEECLRLARELVDNTKLCETDVRTFNGLLLLSDTRVARKTGRWLRAYDNLMNFTGRYGDARYGKSDFDELLFTINVEASIHACERLRLNDVRRHLERAAALERRLPEIPAAVLRSKVEFAMGYTTHWDSPNEAYSHCSRALDLAMASCSAEAYVLATVGLAILFVRGKNERNAREYLNRALEIARAADGSELLAWAAVQAGGLSLETTFWPAFASLLFDVERLCRPHTIEWAWLKAFQAEVLIRTDRFEEALTATTAAEGEARNLGEESLGVLIPCQLAIIAHQLGRDGEAADYARVALASAQESCDPNALVRATRVASAVIIRNAVHLPAKVSKQAVRGAVLDR